MAGHVVVYISINMLIQQHELHMLLVVGSGGVYISIDCNPAASHGLHMLLDGWSGAVAGVHTNFPISIQIT